MKYVFLLTFLLTSSAFAYNASTVGNHPVKEEAIMTEESREPASVQTKDSKPVEKTKHTKVAPDK